MSQQRLFPSTTPSADVDELAVHLDDETVAIVEPVELSVVVTTRNRAGELNFALGSLLEQVWEDGSWDIIVVDNGSTDATNSVIASWAEQCPVPVRVLRAVDQFNPSYARNTAAASTQARSLAFIDDDDVIGPGWVAAMGTALRDHELVGSRFDYHQLNEPEVATHRGGFQTRDLGRLFDVPVVSSGGSGVRRTLWNHLGGHSEVIGYGGEDLDFALRAHRIGVSPTFCHDALYHVRLRSFPAASYRQGVAFSRSVVSLYHDHGRALGAPNASVVEVVRRWAGLAKRLPTIHQRGARLLWSFQLGQRVGHLGACLKQRTWSP